MTLTEALWHLSQATGEGKLFITTPFRYPSDPILRCAGCIGKRGAVLLFDWGECQILTTNNTAWHQKLRGTEIARLVDMETGGIFDGRHEALAFAFS